MTETEVTEAMVEAAMRSVIMKTSGTGVTTLEPATLPDPIRHTAMEYAVRCTPSRVDLIIPLARAIEVYLRGEGKPMSPAASMLELTERVEKRRAVERQGAPPLPAA